MTPEQIQKISALGYFVVNHGQHVEDINKNIVVTKDAEGNCITDVSEIKDILGMNKPKKKAAPKKKKVEVEETKLEMVRARDENGHFIADDPDTEVNEAWVVKAVKKVLKKK